MGTPSNPEGRTFVYDASPETAYLRNCPNAVLEVAIASTLLMTIQDWPIDQLLKLVLTDM